MSNPIVRILVWAGAAGLGLLLLVEAVMWLFMPVKGRARLGMELDNQIEGLKQKAAFNVDESWCRTFRAGPEGATRSVRLLCVGGSATAAVLQNDADTYWGQLATKLAESLPGTAVTARAHIIEGRGILYTAKWLDEALEDEKPDIIIAMGGVDEVFQPADYVYQPGKLAALTTRPQKGVVKDALLAASQICRRISLQRQRVSMAQKLREQQEINYYAKSLARGQMALATLPVTYELPREPGRDPLAEYLDGVKALAAAAQARRIPIVIAGEPSLNTGIIGAVEERCLDRFFFQDTARTKPMRMDPGWTDRELRRLYEAGAAAAAELKVPFLSLHGAVKPVRAHFVEDVLLTDLGAAEAATLLLPVVKPLLSGK